MNQPQQNPDAPICEQRTFQQNGLAITAILPMKEFGGQLLIDTDQRPMLMGQMVVSGTTAAGKDFQQQMPFPINYEWEKGMGLHVALRVGFANYMQSAEAAHQQMQQEQRDAMAGLHLPPGARG